MEKNNEPVSRRAFLKRAGNKALSTGKDVLPEMAAARAVQAVQGAVQGALQARAARLVEPGKALSDPDVVREDITYSSGPDTIEATLLTPKERSGSAPAVIVIHEIFGLTDHIRDVAARLAQAGYVALAPDLYSREGGAPNAADFPALRAFVGGIPDARVVGDLQAAAAYLAARPEVAGRAVGVVGFCMGGLFAMLFAAQTPSLGAGVAFYGRIRPETSPQRPATPLELMPGLKVPLQGHFGEADNGIPLTDVAALREAIPAGVPHEIYTYPDAPHAFHNDTRESYREEPARLAWQRTLAWLDKHLKG